MPKRSDFTTQSWNDISPVVQQRILNGECVSAVNSEGGDDNLWEFDAAEELRLAYEAMNHLGVKAAAREAGVTLPGQDAP